VIRQTREVLDPADSLRALRTARGAVRLPRDAVQVTGPAAVEFLQGQLSQDVDALAVGGAAYSLVLQPQGKVDAWVRVVRRSDDDIVLEVEQGWGDALLARLRRFLLRTKAELQPVPWECVAVRGPQAAAVAAAPEVFACDVGWPTAAGIDLVGPVVALPDDVPECDRAAYDVLRIEQGIPLLGAELDEHTIPAEAGQWLVDVSVSFTKGCYTGQELVARIDSRGGNVPRRLRGVRLDRSAPPGAVVLVDDEAVGELTSCAELPAEGGAVALAYVRRKVEVPAHATIATPGDGADAVAKGTVEELPLR
jgi:tRNA-modifying protein YgfZ